MCPVHPMQGINDVKRVLAEEPTAMRMDLFNMDPIHANPA